MQPKIEYIANHYGFKHQCIKAVEELNELAIALAKSSTKGSLRRDAIEKIADVEIMLAQIKYLAGISQEEIEDCKHYKLDRQMNRIKEGTDGTIRY